MQGRYRRPGGSQSIGSTCDLFLQLLSAHSFHYYNHCHHSDTITVRACVIDMGKMLTASRTITLPTSTVTTSNPACIVTAAPNLKRRDVEKRAVPAALAAYAAAEISSACACLSLSPKITQSLTVTAQTKTVSLSFTTQSFSLGGHRLTAHRFPSLQSLQPPPPAQVAFLTTHRVTSTDRISAVGKAAAVSHTQIVFALMPLGASRIDLRFVH